jgi:hypothetical protein
MRSATSSAAFGTRMRCWGITYGEGSSAMGLSSVVA